MGPSAGPQVGLLPMPRRRATIYLSSQLNEDRPMIYAEVRLRQLKTPNEMSMDNQRYKIGQTMSFFAQRGQELLHSLDSFPTLILSGRFLDLVVLQVHKRFNHELCAGAM